ncbi:uncharacterized protein [Aquarana catesbeiana]|uniref:uncharacterized protein n=1 Tax=Aquarana catesbeiana TaxID=8400 RepID=UPI003CC9B3C7
MQSKRNPVHPQRKTRKREGLEMESGNSDEEDTYVNVCDLGLQKPKKSAKAKAAKNTHIRLKLILMILLAFLFLVLIVFIGILLTSYTNMAEEQTHLRETDKNMAKELSDIRETEKNMAEMLSLLRETEKNMAEMLSLLRKTGSSQPLCNTTWGYYNLSCYYRSSKLIPWNSAKEECEKKSAHLVIINGEDEMVLAEERAQ